MRSSAYAVCFCGRQIKLYTVSFKPVCKAELVLDIAFDCSPASLVAAAEEVAAQLLDHGYAQQAVLVGLDGFQSLMIAKPESVRYKPLKSMKLEVELEEDCPVDAENMVAVKLGDYDAIVAIRNRVEPAIQVLRDQGINVQYVVPISLLLARTLIQKKSLQSDCSLVIGREHVETVDIRNHTVTDWSFFKLAINDPQPPVPIYAIGSNPDDSVISPGTIRIKSTFESVLAQGIEHLVQNRFEPELVGFETLCYQSRQTALGRAMQLTGIGVAFLLASFMVANIWQSHRYGQTAILADSQITQLYATSFPDAPKTRLVERTLGSKCEQLEKQTKLLEAANNTDRILNSLYAVILNVPDDFSIRLDTIRITNGKMKLAGNADSLNALDNLKERFDDYGFEMVQSEQEYGTTFKLSYLVTDGFDFAF